LALQPLGLRVEGDLQVEEAAVAGSAGFLPLAAERGSGGGGAGGGGGGRGARAGGKAVAAAPPRGRGGPGAGGGGGGGAPRAPGLGRLAAAGRGGVVEQVPLGHVEVTFGDLFEVAVAIRVIQAEAGRPLGAAAVPAGLDDELLRPRVRNEGQGVAVGVGVAG